jgi:hypothetical protein
LVGLRADAYQMSMPPDLHMLRGSFGTWGIDLQFELGTETSQLPGISLNKRQNQDVVETGGKTEQD